jgi:hypothetical protein
VTSSGVVTAFYVQCRTRHVNTRHGGIQRWQTDSQTDTRRKTYVCNHSPALNFQGGSWSDERPAIAEELTHREIGRRRKLELRRPQHTHSVCGPRDRRLLRRTEGSEEKDPEGPLEAHSALGPRLAFRTPPPPPGRRVRCYRHDSPCTWSAWPLGPAPAHPSANAVQLDIQKPSCCCSPPQLAVSIRRGRDRLHPLPPSTSRPLPESSCFLACAAGQCGFGRRSGSRAPLQHPKPIQIWCGAVPQSHVPCITNTTGKLPIAAHLNVEGQAHPKRTLLR